MAIMKMEKNHFYISTVESCGMRKPHKAQIKFGFSWLGVSHAEP